MAVYKNIGTLYAIILTMRKSLKNEYLRKGGKWKGKMWGKNKPWSGKYIKRKIQKTMEENILRTWNVAIHTQRKEQKENSIK